MRPRWALRAVQRARWRPEPEQGWEEETQSLEEIALACLSWGLLLDSLEKLFQENCSDLFTGKPAASQINYRTRLHRGRRAGSPQFPHAEPGGLATDPLGCCFFRVDVNIIWIASAQRQTACLRWSGLRPRRETSAAVSRCLARLLDWNLRLQARTPKPTLERCRDSEPERLTRLPQLIGW